MAELNKLYWVAKRGADPTQKLDVMARYYDTVSDSDTIPTSCDTSNLTIVANANDSTTRVGTTFDSDGVITVYLTDSAAAAVNGTGVNVAVYGRTKTSEAGAEPEQITI
jgi:hypothetical protein